jgi:hypothetical protein
MLLVGCIDHQSNIFVGCLLLVVLMINPMLLMVVLVLVVLMINCLLSIVLSIDQQSSVIC